MAHEKGLKLSWWHLITEIEGFTGHKMPCFRDEEISNGKRILFGCGMGRTPEYPLTSYSSNDFNMQNE
jgi:hypothetical protein